MSSTSRPQGEDTPWAESPEQDWDNLLPAVSQEAATDAPEARRSSEKQVAPEQQRPSEQQGAAAVRRSAGSTGSEDHRGNGPLEPGGHDDTTRQGRAQTQRGTEPRTRTARDAAIEDKPRALGLRRALMTIAVPLATLMLGVRAIATPAFLWFEYHRPGFPKDSFGFSTDDRMTYGSYGLEYVLNAAPSRYLGDLTTSDGQSIFTPAEVSHMTDVKHVMLWAMVGVVLFCLVALVGMKGLRRRAPGAIRKSIFWGAWLTLAVLVVLGIFGALGWQALFTGFHEVFFSGGNWAFRESDSLIRLFPEQFWVDAAVGIAIFGVVVSAVLLISTWPTAYRRQRALKSVHDRQEIRDRLSH
jgi:integral membrane protein (TIGR01906 family)